MNKIINYICSFFVIGCIIIAIGYIPINKSVVYTGVNQTNEPFFLIKWTQVTGASWKIIGDENGMYDEEVYINVVGKLPAIAKKLTLSSADNTYMCRGRVIEKKDNDDVWKCQIDEWDIIYPVKRNSFITFLPDAYICLFDLIFE